MATMFNQQPFFNASGHRTHSNQTKMKLHCVQRLVIKKLLVVKSPYGWLGHGKEVDPLTPDMDMDQTKCWNGFIFNLDKILLKKLFPTMNI